MGFDPPLKTQKARLRPGILMIRIYILHDLTDSEKPELRCYTSIRSMVQLEKIEGRVDLPSEDVLYRWKRSGETSYFKPGFIISKNVVRGTGDIKKT